MIITKFYEILKKDKYLLRKSIYTDCAFQKGMYVDVDDKVYQAVRVEVNVNTCERKVYMIKA